MPEIDPRPTPTLAVVRRGSPQCRRFLILSFLLVAAFSPLLWKLIRYATTEETVSHILLVPFICIYLVRIHRYDSTRDGIGPKKAPHSPPKREFEDLGKSRNFVSTKDSPESMHREDTEALHARNDWPILNPRSSHNVLLPSISALIGLVSLLAYWIWGRSGRLNINDALALATLSFYAFFVAITLATVDRQALRPHRFALVFFAFLVPLPIIVTEALSVGLQHASADVSEVTMRLTGMPVFRNGLGFQLPGLRIFVAEECSGIRSTLVLFITSVIAAHLFLRSGWKKAVFVLCVFPIGVFRNALRITVISWLTVNVDSGIIDSALHHRGGPIFFVLSLVPLFALLWWFRKSDRLHRASAPSNLK